MKRTCPDCKGKGFHKITPHLFTGFKSEVECVHCDGTGKQHTKWVAGE